MSAHKWYDSLIEKTDLHSIPHLQDGFLFWTLYRSAYVQVQCSNSEAFIEILNNVPTSVPLIRWHTKEEKLAEELYTLGKKGNLLVLKQSMYGTSIFYNGPAKDFPLSEKTPLHFGKKIWDGGKLLYLEQQ